MRLRICEPLPALTTVSVTSARHDLSRQLVAGHALHGSLAQALQHALAHGWATAFAVDTGFAALALLVALLVIHVRRGEINPAHVH